MSASEILQLAVDGLATSAMLALPAIAFSLIFATMRLSYFGIAGHITVGAYIGYWLNVGVGVPFLPTLPLAFILSGCVGVAVLKAFIEPARGAAPVTLAIMSVAIALLLENVVRAIFGNTMYSFHVALERDFALGDLLVSPLHLRIVAVSAALVVALQFLLLRTQTGRAIRATADNVELAQTKGVNVRALTAVVVFGATGLAGITGIMLGSDAALDPGMGLRIMLSIFAATVVGGLGSIPGAVLGALVVGMSEELSQAVIPATYKGAVAFAAIVVFLAARPRGLLGK